jgi:hypothetical protein
MLLEPKKNTELNNIEFTFNYTKQKIILSLEDIISEYNNYKKKLKTIIKEECLENEIILFEDNIVLYDYENEKIINIIEDLILNKTTKCAIMCIPIVCNHHKN